MSMARYRCTVCDYVYDEGKMGKEFSDLPPDWRCPVCNASKDAFVLLSKHEEQEPAVETTVSDILVEQMAEWGVKFVFGMPGTSILGVLEAIRKNPNLRYIQIRHEQTASFMASAYGKLTGNIAACLTVAGPGSTNLATGLFDAKLDHSPVLALTGMVRRQLAGPGSFQEIDQHAFFEPLVTNAIKHSLLDGGVSNIGIPNDVQKLPFKDDIVPFEGMMPNRSISQSGFKVKDASLLIDKAKRPVIIAGFGALEQDESVLELARRICAPIVSTFRGKGIVDGDNEYYVGCHGMIGSTAATKLVMDSDLLIVLGSSFSELTNIPRKRTVQVDIDPHMIGRKYPVDVGLWGNCSEIVPRLAAGVKERVDEDYLEEMRKLKGEWNEMLEKEADSSLTPIRPQYIVKILNEKLAPDAVITTDPGDNGWWIGRNFWMKSTQKLLISGYLGSMNFGFPASIAAQLAYPDRQVACITGDGGFAMGMGDFLTLVKYELPVNVFIFNNRQLAMIMQEQKVERYANWQTELQDCDYAGFAENCGGVGIRVENPKELPGAVDKALSLKEPTIVDINTDPRRFV
jgi:thiamine pyrophosphate-dependent acetolactate synthase large subunit-like protein/rubredoxin